MPELQKEIDELVTEVLKQMEEEYGEEYIEYLKQAKLIFNSLPK